MCLNPQKIKNPNYRKNPHDKLNFLKDCSNQYIYVPCGHCPECIANKQMQLIQRLQMEATKNYLFFSSITYNEEMIPRFELPKVDQSTGEVIGSWSIRYADVSDLQNMFKRLRKYNKLERPFKYFAVSELGKSRGRPHFHIIWIVPKYPDDNEYTPYNLEKKYFKIILDEWKRKVSVSDKVPVYKPLCTYVRRWKHGKLSSNYDTHYVTPELTKGGESDVGFYVLKYLMKPSTRATRLQQALRLNLDDDEYERIWKIVRPRYFKSKDFGLSSDPDIQDYIHSCVERSKKEFDYPCFINPVDGKTFPLARFYKSKAATYDIMDALDFYYKKKTLTVDCSYSSDDLKTKQEAENRYHKYKKQLLKIDSHDESFELFDDI